MLEHLNHNIINLIYKYKYKYFINMLLFLFNCKKIIYIVCYFYWKIYMDTLW